MPTSDFCSIELIGVTTMGNNNLDFHMAFHLGRFHEIADEDVSFHIISNDTGFNGLINHLKKIGRPSKRVATKPSAPGKDTRTILSDSASFVVSKLKQLDGRKRPRKRAKFMNWIKSQCQGLSNSATPEEVCAELVKAQLIQEAGSDITYKLRR